MLGGQLGPFEFLLFTFGEGLTDESGQRDTPESAWLGGLHEAARLLAIFRFGEGSSDECGLRNSSLQHVGGRSRAARIITFSPFGVQRALVNEGH